jgi:aminopeptidase N
MSRPTSAVRRAVAPLGLALLAALAPARTSAQPLAADRFTYARPDEARVVDVALDLTADFAAHRLSGTARLTVQRSAGAREILLDTRDLEILGAEDDSGRALSWSLGQADPLRGRPLTVSLPDTPVVVVRYRTSPSAAALQWLEPQQTAGGRHPYLFSQGQAILTRTWLPTQDSPGIRQTYSARITVPRGLVAVMSAESLSPNGTDNGDGRTFSFRLDQPIPPYLIAIAVGDIAFKAVGPRTGVYAEPSVVDAAAWEFGDLERMLTAAESLYGAYRWGRYDLLVLPPSFPFGGMENPRLTFMSPTTVAGDRSLTAVAAHEMAHSWSGNLVTNATWADVWLNEGFTTYIEHRIVEHLYGTDLAASHEAVEREDLLALMKNATPSATTLYAASVEDPEFAGAVAYGKGSAFLRLVERAVGRARFDPWLRAYFDRHAFTSITTATFLDELRRTLFGSDAGALDEQLRVQAWIYEPGLPSNAPVASAPSLDRARDAAAAFGRGAPARSLAVDGWTTQQWLHFFAALPEPVTTAQLQDLDRVFGLTERKNSEVLGAWLRIALAHHYDPAVPAAERFLTEQGRLRFLEPLYRTLAADAWGQPIARRIYARARPLYHSISRGTIDALLGAQ